jgi:hypothetical protein
MRRLPHAICGDHHESVHEDVHEDELLLKMLCTGVVIKVCLFAPAINRKSPSSSII